MRDGVQNKYTVNDQIDAHSQINASSVLFNKRHSYAVKFVSGAPLLNKRPLSNSRPLPLEFLLQNTGKWQNTSLRDY